MPRSAAATLPPAQETATNQPALDAAALELGLSHAVLSAFTAATWVQDTARQYGIRSNPSPENAFAGSVLRLSNPEISLDPDHQLLLALHRRHLVSDRKRFALHAIYLRQEA